MPMLAAMAQQYQTRPQPEVPCALLSCYKICKGVPFKLYVIHWPEQLRAAGVTADHVRAAGLSSVCCAADSLEVQACAKCCATKSGGPPLPLISVGAPEPSDAFRPVAMEDGSELFTFECRANCRSSRDHLTAKGLTLVVSGLTPVPLRTPTFELLWRLKNKRCSDPRSPFKQAAPQTPAKLQSAKPPLPRGTPPGRSPTM
eukprot:TRINITY_DN11420_c0_g1_i3.p1 TRINITY_DN11420_c0_g1~~TRINITY_DN11420_c0_g1_i3.p1  ORF type:complete len:222 (+),score=50.65 TRINITY_DN11420_c0_g1_i3:65-667(+)